MNIEAVRILEQEMAPPFPVAVMDCFGWAPYDLDVFSRLLDVAVTIAKGSSFIDAGCGIGTKCLLAEDRGLDAYGIDRAEPYVQRAVELGVRAEVADVRDFPHYGEFDILYVSHPLRPGFEETFEECLFEQMKPGAVFMTLRGCGVPDSWEVVLHEEYQRPYNEPPRHRGVYVKVES